MAGSSNIYRSHQSFTALVPSLSRDHAQDPQYFLSSWQYQQEEAAMSRWARRLPEILQLLFPFISHSEFGSENQQ